MMNITGWPMPEPCKPKGRFDSHIRAIALALAFFIVSTGPAWAQQPSPERSDSQGIGFDLIPGFGEASPPLPDPSIYPVQLVIDDDQAEGVFGLDGTSARQFLWFNQFDVPVAGFHLEEIWVLFPAGMNVPVGGDIELVVMTDTDNDPTNGATIVATFDAVVQFADGDTFSIFPIPSLTVNDGSNVSIGVVNRYFQAADPPPTRPAATDITASQNRSYFALWAADAPTPLDLNTATSINLLAGSAAGNFMIRGFGTGAPTVEIPTLSQTALVLMILMLAALSYRRLRVLRSTASTES